MSIMPKNKLSFYEQLFQATNELDEHLNLTVILDRRDHKVTYFPSKKNILLLIAELRNLIFADFLNQKILEIKTSRKNIRSILSNVQKMLQQQIFSAMLYGNTVELVLSKQFKEQAHIYSVRLLKQLPKIRSLLNSDAQAAYEGDPACEVSYLPILCYPGMLSITYHRIAHELYKYKIPLLPRIISELAHNQTGIDIHPGAEIGNSFFIDHGTGVVIGETTLIGNHATIYHGVTLGAKNFPTDQNGKIIKGIKRHPTIGNNVTIYSNAVILGSIHIGDNSVIGGNVWLTKNVPPNSHIYQDRSTFNNFADGK